VQICGRFYFSPHGLRLQGGVLFEYMFAKRRSEKTKMKQQYPNFEK